MNIYGDVYIQGQNRKGEKVSGERSAESRQALALALRREQILLVDASEKKAGGGLAKFEFGGNPTAKDIAVFTRQFSVMIDSGVPLVQCLQILGEHAGEQEIRRCHQGRHDGSRVREQPRPVDEELSEGVRFDCTPTWWPPAKPAVFSTPFFSASRVYIEKAVKLKRAVQSAMVYPIAVVVIAGGVITLILWKVVPAFTELFESMKVDLPLPTRIVIGASKFVGNYGILLAIGIGSADVRFQNVLRDAQRPLHRSTSILLKAPIFGPLVAKNRSGAFHANDGDADRQRRSDSGLSGNHGASRRVMRSSKKRFSALRKPSKKAAPSSIR